MTTSSLTKSSDGCLLRDVGFKATPALVLCMGFTYTAPFRFVESNSTAGQSSSYDSSSHEQDLAIHGAKTDEDEYWYFVLPSRFPSGDTHQPDILQTVDVMPASPY